MTHSGFFGVARGHCNDSSSALTPVHDKQSKKSIQSGLFAGPVFNVRNEGVDVQAVISCDGPKLLVTTVNHKKSNTTENTKAEVWPSGGAFSSRQIRKIQEPVGGSAEAGLVRIFTPTSSLAWLKIHSQRAVAQLSTGIRSINK